MTLLFTILILLLITLSTSLNFINANKILILKRVAVSSIAASVVLPLHHLSRADEVVDVNLIKDNKVSSARRQVPSWNILERLDSSDNEIYDIKKEIKVVEANIDQLKTEISDSKLQGFLFITSFGIFFTIRSNQKEKEMIKRMDQKEKEMIKRMDQADEKTDRNKNETIIMMNRMFIVTSGIAIIPVVKSFFEK